MSRQRGHAEGATFPSGLDLFPFLSIFLCVMGVLSFLNLVGAAAGPRAVLLTGDVALGHKSAYRILCTLNGMIPIPPFEPLRGLTEAQPTRAAMRSGRAAIRDRLGASAGESLGQEVEPTEATVMAILTEIDTLNRWSSEAGQSYQEFLLLGVYPGGGAVYHSIRRQLDDHPELTVAVGQEPRTPTCASTSWPRRRGRESPGQHQCTHGYRLQLGGHPDHLHRPEHHPRRGQALRAGGAPGARYRQGPGLFHRPGRRGGLPGPLPSLSMPWARC